MTRCPICEDTDELCSHTAPAQAAPWPDARPADDLAAALRRVEALEILVSDLRARVGVLEDRERTSGRP